MKAKVPARTAKKKEADLKKKAPMKTEVKVTAREKTKITAKPDGKASKGITTPKAVQPAKKVSPKKQVVTQKKPVKSLVVTKPLKKIKIQKAAKPEAGRKKTSVKPAAKTAVKKTAQKSSKATAPGKAKKTAAKTAKVTKKKIEKKPAALKIRKEVKAQKKPGAKTAKKAVIKKEISVVKPAKITTRKKETASKAPKQKPKKPVVKPASLREEKQQKVPKVRPLVKLKKAVVKKTAEAVGKSVPELLSIAEIEAKEAKTRPLKIFLPVNDLPVEAEKSYTVVRPESLPEEYGENSLLLMGVDPNNVYLNWEITGTEIPSGQCAITIRVYDVTGKDYEGTDFHSFLDIRLDRRTGSGFFEIMMPGKEVIAEIGLADSQGNFTCILRSSRVSLPPLLQFDEFGIVRKLIEAGMPIGY
jgi:hypothetical protein